MLQSVRRMFSTSNFLQTLSVTYKLCNLLSVTTKSIRLSVAFSEYLRKYVADSILIVANDNG